MTTCHVFIAVSLDGFIARPDGATDWLDVWPDIGHDYGYREFVDSIDGLVMGRGTFENVCALDDWPFDKPAVVMSATLQPASLSSSHADRIWISRSGPAATLAQVEREGWKRAYLDGGRLIQSFLRAGLVDDMVITRIPVLLGAGLPLFGELERDVTLRHVATTAYDSGFVQSRYIVER